MIAFIFVLIAAVSIPGIISRTKAILSGRKGVKLVQYLYNIRLLLRKGAVYSTTSGLITAVAPAIYLGALITASMFVPLGGYNALLHFEGDVVMFVYLLALSRAVLILGALDSGSSFQGMGASREALYGALIEPAIFFVIGTLALMTGNTSFSSIFKAISATSSEMIVVTILLFYIMIKVTLVESGRIPIDDPKTHLELTMIHEVMVLDYCGVDLAFITIGGWIKTASLVTIAAGTIASALPYAGVSAALIILMVAMFAVVIGIIESTEARNRMNRNATYIVTIASLALFAFLLVYILSLNINIS